MKISAKTIRVSALTTVAFAALAVGMASEAWSHHLEGAGHSAEEHGGRQTSETDLESGASEKSGLDLRVLLRGGAGSMFGPGFKTGPPAYAREKMLDSENQKPFNAFRQAMMTYGAAASVELGEVGKWRFGGTALLGFNATSAKRGGMTANLETKEKLQGVTYGVGARASYGSDAHRVSIDVVATQSHLKGHVDWTHDSMFGGGPDGGEAFYEYDVHRFAAMLGYEFQFDGGPFFGFVQGGAQFMPGQTTRRKQRGTVPWVADDDFGGDIEGRQLRKVDRKVQLDPELQYALGAGIGVEF